MKISEVHECTHKEQRTIMAKITTRLLKIQALQNEVDQLRAQLVEVAPENGAWADAEPPVSLESVLGCSEADIPLPTTVGTHIHFGANGMTVLR